MEIFEEIFEGGQWGNESHSYLGKDTSRNNAKALTEENLGY